MEVVDASGRFGVLVRKGMGKSELNPELLAEKAGVQKAMVLAVAHGRAHEQRPSEIRRVINILFPGEVRKRRARAYRLLLIIAPPRLARRHVARVHAHRCQPSRRF